MTQIFARDIISCHCKLLRPLKGTSYSVSSAHILLCHSFHMLVLPASVRSPTRLLGTCTIITSRHILARRAHTHNISSRSVMATQTTNGIQSQTLSPSETTGSTPLEFIPPPDRPEYHPYRLVKGTQDYDWIDNVDLETASAIAQSQSSPLRFLVLYGSLRETSYSRLLAFEMARLLEVGNP